MKGTGTPPDVCIDPSCCAKGISSVPCCGQVQLSRKRNEGEDSPNQLYTVVTYVAVTTLKSLQTVHVDEN